jgi:serine/threonine protein phosphatase PrpC
MAFVTIGSASHVGNRKDKNEDYFSFHAPEDGSMPKKGILLVLADGMGGRAGGAQAAKIAVEVMMEEYYKDKSSNIPKSLNRAFLKANEEVIARGDADRSVQGMAATLIAAVIKKNKMYHAHVGDSRGYLIDGDEIIQFTEDHSIVAGLVKAGYITEEEAPTYPGGNVITKAIGLEDDLKVDVSEEGIKIRPGHYIMICCDGLHKDVPKEEILEVFKKFREPPEICDKLVERALNNSGDDNITVLTARIDKTTSGFFSDLKDRFL